MCSSAGSLVPEAYAQSSRRGNRVRCRITSAASTNIATQDGFAEARAPTDPYPLLQPALGLDMRAPHTADSPPFMLLALQ